MPPPFDADEIEATCDVHLKKVEILSDIYTSADLIAVFCTQKSVLKNLPSKKK